MFIKQYEKISMRTMLYSTSFTEQQLDKFSSVNEKEDYLGKKMNEVYNMLDRSLFLMKVDEYEMYNAMVDGDEHDGLWLYEMCMKLNDCFDEKMRQLRLERQELYEELIQASEDRVAVVPQEAKIDLMEATSMMTAVRALEKVPVVTTVQLIQPVAVEILEGEQDKWRSLFVGDTDEVIQRKYAMYERMEARLEMSLGVLLVAPQDEIWYDDMKPQVRLNPLMYSHRPCADGVIVETKGHVGVYEVIGQLIVLERPDYRVVRGMTRFSVDQTKFVMSDEGEIVDVIVYRGRHLDEMKRVQRAIYVSMLVKDFGGSFIIAPEVKVIGSQMIRSCYVSSGRLDELSYWTVVPNHVFKILRSRGVGVWEKVQRRYCRTGDVLCVRSRMCSNVMRMMHYDEREGFGDVEKFMKKDACYYMHRVNVVTLKEFLM